METEGDNMFVKDFKIDVIVPTADASKWPAKESLL